jgi:AcrR family transcriptional regulator
MTAAASPRKQELLEATYRYVLEHGLVDMSLRPLAEAVGSSPRVLLFLFESKDGLVAALLERAREDELAALATVQRAVGDDVFAVAREVWGWLAAPAHRNLLALWLEAFARSLTSSAAGGGAWVGFAERTVADWLRLLAAHQPSQRRRTSAGAVERTAILAVLRGSMLDLLATGDATRTTRALNLSLRALERLATADQN